MRFKITSVDCNKNEIIHFFDNYTQEIWTEQGIPVKLSEDPRCQGMKRNFKEYEEDNIKNNLRELRIQVGLNCNFGCKYCNQRHGAEIEKAAQKHEIKLPDEIRIKNFIQMLKDKEIKTDKIALWGGEPFVYWKLLQKLVPALRTIYPDAVIAMISNGSLIDEEKVDFCLKHKIALTVSHDAQAFTVYRNDKNPLDNPKIIKALNRYMDAVKDMDKMWFGINVVVVPENCDILKIDNYFTEKFGRKVKGWHFESIAKLDCDSEKVISKFSEEQKRTLLNGLMALGTMEPEEAISDIRNRVSRVLEGLINSRSVETKLFPCDVVSDDVIATTLEGEMLACHGASKELFTIGHLKDLGNVKNTKCISWKERNDCKSCPYVLSCGGACAISSNENIEAACENMKLWYTGLFASAWFILFNTVIQKIERV